MLVLVSFLSVSCFAQGQYILFVDGTVKEGKSKLVGSTVTVYEDGDASGSIVTNASGKFGFELMMDHEYIIEFSKMGYVSKKISVSTKGVPEDEAEFGFEFGGWQVGLFKTMEGLDVSILDKPVGKIFYVEADNGFDYDAKYTKSIREELAQLQSDLADKLEAQKIAEQNYKRAIAAADKALGVSNYLEAIANYTIALEAKVGDSYAAGKLAEAELKTKEADAAQAEEEAKQVEFEDLMARADAKFKAKDYDVAKAGYTAAIGVKPNEKLPKDQIKKIDDLLAKAAEEKKLAKEAEVKRLADEQAAEESRLKAEAEEKRLAEEAEVKRLADEQAAEEERLAKEVTDKAEADRIATEQKAAQAAQAEEERLAKELADKAEADRIATEQKAAQAAQAEEERLAKESADKAEADRIATEQKAAQAALAEEERLAKEAADKAEADKLAKEFADKAESDRLVNEQKEAQATQAEEERLAKEAADKAEADKLAKEAADKADADRLANEQKEAQEALAEEERLAKEAADKSEADKLAKAAADKASADRLVNEQKEAQATQAEEERLVKEAQAVQAEEERLANEAEDKSEADRLANEQKEAQSARAEKERLAKAAADNAEANRLANEAADKSEADRLAVIKADQEAARLRSAEAAEAAEAERLARLDKISSEKYSLSEYRDVIDKADLHYNFKKYEAALIEYENALAMRPDQDYPKERISLIKKMIGIQANRESLAKENQENNQIPIEDFKNDIAQKYPEGVTEEVETLGNKTITKRYVVKNNRGDEYKMIKHNWGGKFFFKNEQQITELIWNKETGH